MAVSRAQSGALVVVIDDDADVRSSLDSLFRSVGLRVESYGSVAAYDESGRHDRPGCLVLDVRLPGMSGNEFQDELARRGSRRPIVFISGHADIAMCARAMKAGAVDFLSKPVRDQDLLDAVQRAISEDERLLKEERAVAQQLSDIELLTSREREVMSLVITGRRNKQIAADLGVSEGTVKLYRGQIMRKLNIETFADLVRIADLFEKARLGHQDV